MRLDFADTLPNCLGLQVVERDCKLEPNMCSMKRLIHDVCIATLH